MSATNNKELIEDQLSFEDSNMDYEDELDFNNTQERSWSFVKRNIQRSQKRGKEVHRNIENKTTYNYLLRLTVTQGQK